MLMTKMARIVKNMLYLSPKSFLLPFYCLTYIYLYIFSKKIQDVTRSEAYLLNSFDIKMDVAGYSE